MNVDAIYRALWRWAEGPVEEIKFSKSVHRQPEVVVRYWLPESAPHDGTLGWFSAHGFNGKVPQLGIIRDRVPPDPHAPDPRREELMTLAHEGGHAHSWRKRERPKGTYEQDVDRPITEWPTFSDEAKRAILDEETRAWRYGREALAKEGFDDWPAFDAAEAAGLGKYRSFLWPDQAKEGHG